jgi:hypothetical protein
MTTDPFYYSIAHSFSNDTACLFAQMIVRRRHIAYLQAGQRLLRPA